jgi:predicted Ser/Thr protein kinase
VSEDLVGRKIGNYEILREIGRGGMGVVYEAHEQSLQRVVALKTLAPHLAEDEVFVKRFFREARAAARLSHPNTVHIYAVGEDSGVHFLAMEYVKGDTLGPYIRERGRLSVREACDIARQVALALKEAHDHGIVHRDIKPQNILIDEAGRVRVMDFGLAKGVHAGTSLTQEGTVVGTPAYMSPEQVQGQTVDGRSDVYSLGVTLFEMLAGKPPFEADTPMSLMYQIVRRPVPDLTGMNPEVPQALADIVAQMTAKAAGERHQSAGQVVDELAGFAGSDVTVPAPAASLPSPGDADTAPVLARTGKKKTCPKCAEVLKLEATICRFCGHEFPPGQVDAEVRSVMHASLTKSRRRWALWRGVFSWIAGLIITAWMVAGLGKSLEGAPAQFGQDLFGLLLVGGPFLLAARALHRRVVRREGKLLHLAATTPMVGTDTAAVKRKRYRWYLRILLAFLGVIALLFLARAAGALKTHGPAVAGAPILRGMFGYVFYTVPAWITVRWLRRRARAIPAAAAPATSDPGESADKAD